MLLTKEELRPGMRVRNNLSYSLGILRPDNNNPQKLFPAPAGKVAVCVGGPIGDHPIRHRHVFWSIVNIRREA